MLYLGKNAVVPAITVSGGEVTSVITATNNTGSAISEGDKVWINQEDGNTYELVNYYSSVPNFNTVGSPTITNGVASGFSVNNYLKIPQKFNPSNNAWEVNLRFTTGSNISTSQLIFGQIDGFTSGKNSIWFGIINNDDVNEDLLIGLSSNGSSYDIVNGLTLISSIQANTEYNVKIIYDNTLNEYNFFVNNEQIGNAVSGNPICNDSTLIFGNERAAGNPFLGSIDLKETYIKIDGADWWTPYATNITSATQTGTAAENIASGGTGLVNVGAVIEPTGSITITENGTHNVADYAEAVVNVPVPVVDKYKVGDRVNDDSNNPVGTVSSIFTDGNGQRYAVVCLDAVNRLASGQWLNSDVYNPNIPNYTTLLAWSAPETATTNTEAILNTAGTSEACTHCRSKSFIIEGTTYYGQLPNLNEVAQIFIQRTIINNQDPTASSYSSLIIPASGKKTTSSTKYNDSSSHWYFQNTGGVSSGDSATNRGFVIPVLEIPLEG